MRLRRRSTPAGGPEWCSPVRRLSDLARLDVDGLVTEAIERSIHDDGEGGLQVAAYLGDDLIVDTWGGLADETTRRKVGGDTLFNIFSVTKALTVTALHVLAQRGHIEYEAKIARYWPEFATHGKGTATVRHALCHRAGIPQMPAGCTMGRMCDWDGMVTSIADLAPLYPPGTMSAYHAYTFGWIIGELVQRTDPLGRRIDRFILEEICQPLGIRDFWMGIPPELEMRIARLRDETVHVPLNADISKLPLVQRVALLAIPNEVSTTPEHFMQPAVKAAWLPGMGGIADARSIARFFAMLANGGRLGDVRLLSDARVRSFCQRRPRVEGDELDLDDMVVGQGGFHLPSPPGQRTYYHVLGSRSPILAHAGTGKQVGWPQLDTGLAVAILHNRLSSAAPDPASDPLVPIARAVRKAAAITAGRPATSRQ